MQRLSYACVLSLVCCGAVLAADRSSSSRPEKSAADVEAQSLVQQALLAESLGNNDQRAQRLSQALLAAPQSSEVNWHLARVQCEGEWLPIAVAVNRYSTDPDREKYTKLREKVLRSDSPASGVKALRDLAVWCQRSGLADVARVHFAQLLSHPASSAEQRSEAIKALDLHRVGETWMTGKELAQRQESAKAAERAFERWEVPLRKLRDLINGDAARPREKALTEFAQLDDPALLPVLESQLAGGSERFHLAAIRLLTEFPQYEATCTLARCAVLSSYPEARAAATSALKDRPLHEFVPLFLAELVAPLKSQFRVGWDAQGRIGYSHAVLQEGLADNRLLMVGSTSLPNFQEREFVVNNRRRGTEATPLTSTTTFVGNGKSRYEAFTEELDNVQLAAAQREAQLNQANAAIEKANERLYEVLETSTSQPLPRQPAAWGEWWKNYNDYQIPRPTQYAYQHNTYVYSSINNSITTLDGTFGPAAPRPTGRGLRWPECFVQGTPIRTDRGLVPIETLLPGDRVLAQNCETGELAFKPILGKTLRPPTKVMRIRAGGEEIVTTPGHPFWVSGRGWRMARSLQVGDLLHGIGGAVAIESVEQLPQEQPVHNLDVDDFSTYFVGKAGLLVHDNEFRRPTTAIVPGLAKAN